MKENVSGCFFLNTVYNRISSSRKDLSVNSELHRRQDFWVSFSITVIVSVLLFSLFL